MTNIFRVLLVRLRTKSSKIDQMNEYKTGIENNFINILTQFFSLGTSAARLVLVDCTDEKGQSESIWTYRASKVLK